MFDSKIYDEMSYGNASGIKKTAEESDVRKSGGNILMAKARHYNLNGKVLRQISLRQNSDCRKSDN